MNVKEQHVVTGMSRDSAVSQHNPNLVYDAHNIRITTKDGRNSLLSVTNERGTKELHAASGSDTIVGLPIGSAILDKYIIIFTHEINSNTATPDHIFRCSVENDRVSAKEVFVGNANFDAECPIETLPVFETKTIQKVYWVDGKNQPRMINIIVDNAITDTNTLEFSPSVTLSYSMTVRKSTSGGEFPVGTIQYAFSYFKLNGQETRLIDISPMYYLSPQNKGLDATSISNASFNIVITGADTSFKKIRVYAVVRTQENAVPQCRIVGDYDIQNIRPSVQTGVYGIDIIDNGVIGRTVSASSLYFIGGEKLIAGTLAQKDNTLFLGNVELTIPNLSSVKTLLDTNPITPSTLAVGYRSISDYGSTPIKSKEYYGYEPDNNRSSYFVKTFKYQERYKLGFIAQYENGQWSEPLSLGIVTNSITPEATVSTYKRGGFKATITTNIVSALRDLNFKRIAPVVVYPRTIGRRTVAQGILCPTLSTYEDRESNSPFAQSSWFFRFNTCETRVRSGSSNVNVIDDKIPLYSNFTYRGEIQCMDFKGANNSEGLVPSQLNPDNDLCVQYESKYSNWFYYNTNVATLHSPEVECTGAGIENLDLSNTKLYKIGNSYLSWDDNSTVVDHFLEVEGVGINTDRSQVIKLNRIGDSYDQKSFTLYCDSAVNKDSTDDVSTFNNNYVHGWVVYPWHRSGSLNNQAALNTSQKANGFNTRTAMLKRNITARAHFATTMYTGSAVEVGLSGCTPKVFSSDQLSGVSLNIGGNSKIYYGNIDKVLVPENGFYYSYFGWTMNVETETSGTTANITQKAREYHAQWPPTPYIVEDDLPFKYMKVSDPISMKYKSSPHIVVGINNNVLSFADASCGNAGSYLFPDKKAYKGGLHIVELVRQDITDELKFGDGNITSDSWIRCGDSVELPASGSATLNYLQGDCYFQMYDCLKTYPFTQEDTNSVIEILSTMLETYVNLDFKYDKNRGASNNVALSPTNFNLFNDSAYNQSGNFFSYHQLDYSLLSNKNFPNVVTWSLEKHLGEDVDTWMSIDANNTIELDGAFGRVNKLINYNNDIYCFQDIGLSQLLFNSRVQIPTSDQTPIEITNGMKMDGKRYISTKVGCTNKWSIIETPLGLYFNDDILKSTYLFNGQLADLSTTKGMKSWLNETCNQQVWNPVDFGNCRAFYDKVGRDVYWVYGPMRGYPSGIALVYSEILNQYMSFTDYGNVPLIESVEDSTYAITNNYKQQSTAEVTVPFKAGEVVVNGILTFTLNSQHTKTVNLQVEWINGSNPRNPYPAASVYTDESGMNDVVDVTLATCATYSSDLYTLGDILTALQAALPSYITASLNVATTNPVAYRDSSEYVGVDTYLTNRTTPPFWELGKGDYNVFFGVHKPYWITFISNTNPTQNKIYNNVAWRDIVTSETTTQPFHTFDHIRVWNEHQDTRPVRLSNSLSQDASRQPISYDAAVSNLRKKFNVWRCQIPRDKLASNSGRARISNPWTYIKLSREDLPNTERHELTDVEVDYFM